MDKDTKLLRLICGSSATHRGYRIGVAVFLPSDGRAGAYDVEAWVGEGHREGYTDLGHRDPQAIMATELARQRELLDEWLLDRANAEQAHIEPDERRD